MKSPSIVQVPSVAPTSRSFARRLTRLPNQVLVSAKTCSPGTLLTDTGSTKSIIVREIESRLPDGALYVGSHPLAGSERRGVEHADANLLEGRLTIVTQTPRTSPEAVQRAIQFWQALGSRTRVMDPEEHDRAVGLTSHLPHLLASALAGILPPELRDLAATGFRDTTRVAAGDPSLWSAVFQQNRPALLASLCASRAPPGKVSGGSAAGTIERLCTLCSRTERNCAMLWEVEIQPKGEDRERDRIAEESRS